MSDIIAMMFRLLAMLPVIIEKIIFFKITFLKLLGVNHIFNSILE